MPRHMPVLMVRHTPVPMPRHVSVPHSDTLVQQARLCIWSAEDQGFVAIDHPNFPLTGLHPDPDPAASEARL